jgi:hypothetical protein
MRAVRRAGRETNDMFGRFSSVAVAGLIVSVVATAGADAQSRPKVEAGAQITACGTYNRGCITVPVRRGPNGYEFRLPGGTWIACRGSCRDTLREETVDFWETQRENQPF